MMLIPSRLSIMCWFLSFNFFMAALLIMWYNLIILIEWSMFNPLISPIKFMLIMDVKGCLFAATVMFISANVFYFSSFYMSNEQFLKRFSLIVVMFILSMALLILIPHMMYLLLGWDGLGLVSFALVIYYQNPKSLGAGMITALTNRIGDVMLLIAISWSIMQGHWSITTMFVSPYNSMISLLIILAATTKSAQMPFSSWLPAAMAAPTPVSALVHSSTLVTAGVFLLIRFFPFLCMTPLFTPILLIMSTMTMLMAGIAAMAECDLKKIIALSTLSQLGVMMMSLALHLDTLAFFHLITHAMFKALLFLAAGTIIHLSLHSQDLRTVGNMSPQLPLTLSCMTIANLALMGAPFLAGFYSKDLILESSMFLHFNPLIILMSLLATSMTGAYSLRFMASSAWTPTTMTPLHMTSDNSHISTTPMLFLSLTAIFMGSMLNWSILPFSLEPTLPTPTKLTPLLAVVFGSLLAWKMTSPQPNHTSNWLKASHTHFFNTSMWLLTPLSTQYLIKPSMRLAKSSSHSLDFGWWEYLLPQLTFFSFISKAKLMSQIPAAAPTSLVLYGLIFTVPSLTLFLLYL